MLARRRAKPLGFTLIELLVVIAIVAVLVALLLPAIQRAREAAHRSQCQNNLKQLGLALHTYHDGHGVFPFAVSHVGSFTGGTAGNRPRVLNHKGWLFLLPFLDYQALYDEIDFDLPTGGFVQTGQSGTLGGPAPGASGNRNDLVASRSLSVFLCPSDDGPTHETLLGGNYGISDASEELGANTNYDFSAMRFSWIGEVWSLQPYASRRLFGPDSCSRLRDIQDGTSKTAMVLETTRDVYNGNGPAWGYAKWVGSGVDLEYPMGINFWLCCSWWSPPFTDGSVGVLGDWSTMGSLHDGGAQLVLADGSVAFLGQAVGPRIRQGLSRIADGGPIDGTSF